MKVGFIGLGKLGLPVALALEQHGHEIVGYDTNPAILDMVAYRGTLPYVEEGAQELLDRNNIVVAEPSIIARECDLIFVAVQTPHQPQFEGATRLTDERADFDYTHLFKAVASIDHAECPIVVISTVLPGTMESVLFNDPSLWLDRDQLIYNPFFIAMGTTIPDFLRPEFVLIGTDGAWPEPLQQLYWSLPHNAPHQVTSIRTAELTKVAYNTFIGLKVAFANTMMELCEKTGADVDDLIDTLLLGDRRIISGAYMRGGMGDGGGCHPRDNIALSWLARDVGLSYDLFGAIMDAREKQTEWLGTLIHEQWLEGREVELLGRAYKAGTALEVGSPAVLLSNILREWGIEHAHTDVYGDGDADQTEA